MPKVVLAMVVVMMTLAACGETYDRQMSALETAVRWIKVGHSNDYWMEMKNAMGEWERLALVFGYWNDYEGCQDIIEVLGKKNYAREYRCVPANR